MSGLGKSALAGFLWQYASVFSQGLLQLAVFAVLARLLTPADFGLLGIAMIFVGFASLLSRLGVGPAIIQRDSLTDKHIRVGFTLSILSSVVLMVTIWAVTPAVAMFFDDPRLPAVLYAVSLNFVLVGFGVVAESLLRRELLFRRLMWANVGSYALGYAVLGITLAATGFGVWALVGATLAQGGMKSLLLLLWRPHPVVPSLARQELWDLVRFGGGFTLARIFNYSASKGDYFVVGRALGAGQLGLYTRAYQLMMLPATYFGQVLNSVLFPVMAKVQGERTRLRRIYGVGIAMTSLVSAPLSALMIVSAPEIVAVVLGSKWLEAIIPFQILAVGVLPRVSYKIDDSLARALGVMYRRSVRDAAYAGAVVLGSWMGLRWGLQGVAVGVLCAVVLNHALAVRMSLTLLECSASEWLKAQAPGVLVGTAVLLVTWPTRLALSSGGWSPVLVLAGTALMSGMTVVALLLLKPRVLGVHGADALAFALRSVPASVLLTTMSRWMRTRFEGV